MAEPYPDKMLWEDFLRDQDDLQKLSYDQKENIHYDWDTEWALFWRAYYG